MGSCATRFAPPIDSERRETSHAGGETAHKILLLGPGDAGKSTFLKQLTELYGEQQLQDNIDLYLESIYGNVIDTISILIRKSQEFSEWDPQCSISKDLDKSVEKLLSLDKLSTQNMEIDDKIAASIRSIWSDPGLQMTYANRTSFRIQETAPFFFDKIEEIGSSDYIPTKEDIINCRLRTTGLNQLRFEFGTGNFHILDVGGQRSERRKWIQNFQNCRAVIFFVAISDYDVCLFEDVHTNGLTEALQLFEQVANSHWFENTEMILFFNKMDIFNEKLQRVPLSDHFPEFSGEKNDVNAAKDFMERQFQELYRYKRARLTTHFTTMTDGGNVIDGLFQDVSKILLREDLEKLGFK